MPFRLLLGTLPGLGVSHAVGLWQLQSPGM